MSIEVSKMNKIDYLLKITPKNVGDREKLRHIERANKKINSHVPFQSPSNNRGIRIMPCGDSNSNFNFKVNDDIFTGIPKDD